MVTINNPGLSSGLLPTPKSPVIENGMPESYIKRSYFPIPYQLVVVVEGCNINNVLAWDINVTSKSVKVKVEYSIIDESTNSLNCELFPRAVVDSISTYDLEQPVWSSSFSSKKLAIRIEWIRRVSAKDGVHCVSPNGMFTPKNSSKFRSNLDSGYASSPPSSNRMSNLPGVFSPNNFPSTRLNFNTPKKSVHDIYKPPPRNLSTNVSMDAKVHDPKVEASTSKILPENQPSDKVTSLSNPSNVEHSDNCGSTQVYLPESSIVSIPENLSAIPPTKLNHESVSDDVNPISDLKSTNSPHKYVILDESSDGHIVAELNEKCVPWNDIFLQPPMKYTVSKKLGTLDQTLEASCMNILGKCRLCGKKSSSFQADEHLLQCPKIPRDDIDTFCVNQAKSNGTTDCDIEAMALGYCEHELIHDDIDKVFSTVSDFRQFIHDLEQFLDERAASVYKSLNMAGQIKRFNILKYPKL